MDLDFETSTSHIRLKLLEIYTLKERISFLYSSDKIIGFICGKQKNVP